MPLVLVIDHRQHLHIRLERGLMLLVGAELWITYNYESLQETEQNRKRIYQTCNP